MGSQEMVAKLLAQSEWGSLGILGFWGGLTMATGSCNPSGLI